MNDKLKAFGTVVLGICMLVGSILLIFFFVKGGVWLGARVYPWLVVVAGVTFWITLLIFLPLAALRATRAFAGTATYCASYIFGLTLWVWGLLLSYSLWGVTAIVIGLLFAGIGVVPVAMLASLFNGLWGTLGELVLLTIITFGSRALGIYIMSKIPEPQWPTEVIGDHAPQSQL